MANTKNDDYILEENYHGDVKLIRNNSKKVDLSKPTDTLEHKSKQIETLKVYTNKEKICLTKPKDIPLQTKNTTIVNQTLENNKISKQSVIYGIKCFIRFIYILLLLISLIYFINGNIIFICSIISISLPIFDCTQKDTPPLSEIILSIACAIASIPVLIALFFILTCFIIM